MKRREFLLGMTAAAASPRPSILFLMPDQWRGMDLGCAGNDQVRTPNIDRVAREGVLFRNAVANCPVCTPARSILLTGKYAHATHTAINDVPLPESEDTIAKILASNGYSTGFVGKWHLEGGKRLPGFVPPGPRRMGFQFWAANICSHDYFHQQYFRDDPTPIKMPGYDAFTWTDLALEFLNKTKSPYCLYVQYPSPHDPYLSPPGFENMYAPEKIHMRPNWKAGAKRGGTAKEIAGYYAAMACLDQQIGRLLEKVDDNTIVVVTSDHGDMLGSHGTFLKRKPWEESVRVPGIVRWPAGIKGGWQSDAPFSHVDFVPTLLALCGVSPPRTMHGADYSDHLRRRTNRTPEFAHLMMHTKTELNEFDPWRGLRSRRYKYARFKDRPWLLYDLQSDAYEMTNLVDDPRHAKLMRAFDTAIERRMRATGDRWEELHDAAYR